MDFLSVCGRWQSAAEQGKCILGWESESGRQYRDGLPLDGRAKGRRGWVSLSEPGLTLVFVPPAMEADDSIRGCLACCHAVAGGAGGVTGERKGKSTPPLANERKWRVVVAEYAYSPHIRALCRGVVKSSKSRLAVFPSAINIGL